MQLHLLLWAGFGGFLGSAARYLANVALESWKERVSFPIATLAVNLLGCWVIGVLAHLSEARDVFSPEARVFVFTGILGGFTTFSAFGNETVLLLRANQTVYAGANVLAHIALGLAAVWLGRTFGEAIVR